MLAGCFSEATYVSGLRGLAGCCRPDVQIFRDLNLHAAAGQTVALVGESGSGALAHSNIRYNSGSATVLLSRHHVSSFTNVCNATNWVLTDVCLWCREVERCVAYHALL